MVRKKSGNMIATIQADSAQPRVAAQLRDLSEAEFAARVDQARTEHEQLSREATRLEMEANTAAQKFKDSPDAETMAAKEINRQRAVNAREAVTKHEQKSAPIHEE